MTQENKTGLFEIVVGHNKKRQEKSEQRKEKITKIANDVFVKAAEQLKDVHIFDSSHAKRILFFLKIKHPELMLLPIQVMWENYNFDSENNSNILATAVLGSEQNPFNVWLEAKQNNRLLIRCQQVKTFS
jgi:spore maturation protein SpmA